jgi:hypothetical protein
MPILAHGYSSAKFLDSSPSALVRKKPSQCGVMVPVALGHGFLTKDHSEDEVEFLFVLLDFSSGHVPNTVTNHVPAVMRKHKSCCGVLDIFPIVHEAW